VLGHRFLDVLFCDDRRSKSVDTVDEELHHWISVANESRERYGFPPGLIEERIFALRTALTPGWLQQLLFDNRTQLMPFDPRGGQTLRRWLRGSNVDESVTGTIELATYLQEFSGDECLSRKIRKLQRDSFWPIQFELAMAYRFQKVVKPGLGNVKLSCEDTEAVADFSIILSNEEIAVECTRLGFPNEGEEQYRLIDRTYRYIEDAVKSLNERCCIKIRMEENLTGVNYSRLLVRLKKAIRRFQRTGHLSTDADVTISVTVEPLTPDTEEIPFRLIDNRVVDVKGTDWTTALSIGLTPARDDRELARKVRLGEPVNPREKARALFRFPLHRVETDQYDRLIDRIRKKISQIKLLPGFAGRIVLAEWPFDPRGVDLDRIDLEMSQLLRRSEHTFALILARREANPHYRHHYSTFCVENRKRLSFVPNLQQTLHIFLAYDTIFDPVTNEPYQRSWADARRKALSDQAEDERRKSSTWRESN
jgi:hypothetical protein